MNVGLDTPTSWTETGQTHERYDRNVKTAAYNLRHEETWLTLVQMVSRNACLEIPDGKFCSD